MITLLESSLNHLEKLVAFDTRNPPRRIDPNGIFTYIRHSLADFHTEYHDLGEGCVYLLARRGITNRLFNFHIDTVPDSSEWNTNPFELLISNDKAYGLGACDIKGASACMLTAAQRSSSPLALLFTSDEEAGSSQCVQHFIRNYPEYSEIIVAEPTLCKAVIAHRGFASLSLSFKGVAGHGSESRALNDNAIHRALNFSEKLLKFADNSEMDHYQGLQGTRINIGTINGGIKNNIIAPHCNISLALRTLPNQHPKTVLTTIKSFTNPQHLAEIKNGFLGPTLPNSANPKQIEEIIKDQLQLVNSMGINLGDAVDFWTEASLFSEAGKTAFVFGSGNIEQAHSANEWVALSQLEYLSKVYTQLANKVESTA